MTEWAVPLIFLALYGLLVLVSWLASKVGHRFGKWYAKHFVEQHLEEELDLALKESRAYLFNHDQRVLVLTALIHYETMLEDLKDSAKLAGEDASFAKFSRDQFKVTALIEMLKEEVFFDGPS